MIRDEENNVLLLEPRTMYDAHLLGLTDLDGQLVAVYSREGVIDALVEEFSRELENKTDEVMDNIYLEALDYYDYNIQGSVGKGYPIYVSTEALGDLLSLEEGGDETPQDN